MLVTEVTIDIDGDKRRSDAATCSRMLAERIVEELLAPLGLKCYIEPSRNGRGAYVRFRVRWSTSDFVERNGVILGLERYLQEHFPTAADMKVAAETGLPTSGAGVDKVRGLNSCWVTNPKFDEARYFSIPDWMYKRGGQAGTLRTNGEIYESRKRKRGPDGPYIPSLEPLVRIHAGDLVTMPLFGIGKLPPTVAQQRLNEWVEYDGDSKNTVAQETIVKVIPPVKRSVSRRIAKKRVDPETDPSIVIPEEQPSYDESETADVDMQILPCPLPPFGRAKEALQGPGTGDNEYLERRSVLAAYAVRCAKGDRHRAIGHTLFLWGQPNGPSTRMELHQARVARAIADVDYWLAQYDETKLATTPLDHVRRRERRFTEADVQATQDQLTSMHGIANLTKAFEEMVQIKSYKDPSLGPDPRTLLKMLAVTHCWLTQSVVTRKEYVLSLTGQTRWGLPGDAPTSDLEAALVDFGCPRRRLSRTAAMMVSLLVKLNHFILNRNYCKGASRNYRFGEKHVSLPWVSGAAGNIPLLSVGATATTGMAA